MRVQPLRIILNLTPRHALPECCGSRLPRRRRRGFGGWAPLLLGLVATLPALPTLAAPDGVPAVSADAFIDSIGLNGLGGPYVFHYTGDRARFYDTAPAAPEYVLGVRHARYEIRTDTDLAPMVEITNDQGIRIDALISWLWADPALNKGGAHRRRSGRASAASAWVGGDYQRQQ